MCNNVLSYPPQAIFWHDDTHYLAHVLCGKAHLRLKEVEEARDQYRTAVTSNEKELLAWKVHVN